MISHHDYKLYCFSDCSPPALMQFCIWINQFSKHLFHSEKRLAETWHLQTSTTSLELLKRWLLVLLFMNINKKKSMWAMSKQCSLQHIIRAINHQFDFFTFQITIISKAVFNFALSWWWRLMECFGFSFS